MTLFKTEKEVSGGPGTLQPNRRMKGSVPLFILQVPKLSSIQDRTQENDILYLWYHGP